MGSRRVWAQEGWTLCWGLKMKEDIWLAVQLESGTRDNKQGNGDLSLQPQSAKFCPFSCRASRGAQLAWESLLWYLSRGPSHAWHQSNRNTKSMVRSNKCPACYGNRKRINSTQLPSQGDQCFPSFPGCTISPFLLLFWFSKLYSSTSLFSKLRMPLFLVIFNTHQVILGTCLNVYVLCFFSSRRQTVRTEATLLKEYTF